MVPVPVRYSVVLWLTAIALGAAEALVHLALPDPPPAAQLGVRFAIYAALTVLVLGLCTGRDAIRWTVAVVMGGVGTASLVAEPVAWLLDGGAPLAYLAAADGPALLVLGLRAAHLAAVLAALALLFLPAAHAFFRPRRPARITG